MGKVVRAAEAARQKNLSSVTVPLPLMMQMGISSMDEELNRSFALTVRPIAKVETLDNQGDTIFSWYKLKLLQAYSHARLSDHEDQATLLAHLPNIPRTLLPLSKDEIIVRFIGGTMAVDGVRVTNGSPNDNLELGQTYFLFAGRLHFNDSSVSNSEFAPIANWSSVFKLDADKDSLVPLLPQQNSAVQTRVLEEFHGKLHELSQKIPGVAP